MGAAGVGGPAAPGLQRPQQGGTLRGGQRAVRRRRRHCARTPALNVRRGLGHFHRRGRRRRLGSCAGKECRCVVADVSRGGRRAYCLARRGNTDAVQRYRDRQRVLRHRARSLSQSAYLKCR
ncbi:CGNR zinc finger domain-containing protein [Arthrobacter sp. GCM10027362]|uniref:CGNR zinc finger domain-containing protein n=1 Tax=Arthrobacter sp. GCM10027362 TaxID=3273379 RepID=UPI0036282684